MIYYAVLTFLTLKPGLRTCQCIYLRPLLSANIYKYNFTMNGRRNKKMDLPLDHKIPQLKISWCLKISVMLALSGYTSYIVYQGPLCSLLRNSTVIRKNELNTEGRIIIFIRISKSICSMKIG